MRPTPGWGLSSHRCRMEKNTRWSTSAESCPLWNKAMPRSRRRRWPLSGQSRSSGTNSSAVNSPSLLTMPLYSGWPGRRTPTRRVTRWFLALQDFHFVVRHRAGTANANADGSGQLSQVCQDSFPPPPQPQFPRPPTDPG